MLRILLPVAVIAVILFLPIFSETVVSSEFGENKQTYTGYKYAGDTIQCFIDRNYSISGDCEPKGGLKGKAIFGAVFVSAVAAVLGILGFLPIIGRLIGAITTIAGVIVIAAIGYFVLTQMGADTGAVEYGSYLAGGGGLLTLISGLSGMRGR